MINLLISKHNDPAFNLAIEEYLVYKYKSDNDIMFFWQNQNTIVVGRNQNTFAEINIKNALDNNVKIVRRNTGGGTVFHDLGNICYSIIVNNKNDNALNYQKALQPIINLLKKHSINAMFSGRNDIVIDTFKVSGNAQLKTLEKTLIHGTLLFDVDLSKIKDYLIVDEEKIKHQKIKSKSSRVKNIIDFYNDNNININIDSFLKQVIDSYIKENDINLISFSEEEWKEIYDLVNKKYTNWDWNFGKHSDCLITKKQYIENKGFLVINFNIDNGYIQKINFFGDFLGTKGTLEIENALTNIKYDKFEISEILNNINIADVFGENFNKEDILNLLFK